MVGRAKARYRRSSRILRSPAWWVCAVLWLLGAAIPPQVVAVQGGTFSGVEVDELDNPSRARLERADALLEAGQGEEAVESIRRVMESNPNQLVATAVADDLASLGFIRYLPGRTYCQILLASLARRAPGALESYRRQVDPLARQRYDEAMQERDPQRLGRIVDEWFLSSVGDDAAYWLGEYALERGHSTTARAAWERISPQFRVLPPDDSALQSYTGFPHWLLLRDTDLEANWTQLEPLLTADRMPASRLAYPDSDLELPEVRAALALVSILEGNTDRADVERRLLAQLAPEVRGRIGGREGKLVDLLASWHERSLQWLEPAAAPDWTTFAGSPDRMKAADRTVDVGGAAIWQMRLSGGDPEEGKREGADLYGVDDPAALLRFHPVAVGDLVLLQTGTSDDDFRAVELQTGEVAMRRVAGSALAEPTEDAESGDLPLLTMTASDRVLYACVDQPEAPRTRLVGFDLQADLKLQTDIRLEAPQWEGEWMFGGPPVVDGQRLYVAVRKLDPVRPESHVACFDARTGRLVWRRFLCASEAPSSEDSPEGQNLLSLAEGTLYCNTNLGLIAALRARDGAAQWAVRYPRSTRNNSRGQRGELTSSRALNPCLVYRDMVIAAPRDCERLFCLDAITGIPLWVTPAEQAADAVHLLGVAHGNLVASGECLYWFDIATGQLAARFPSAFSADPAHARPAPRGWGRGLLAGDAVLWPTRESIYVFRQRTIKTEEGRQPVLVRQIPLAPRGATGGNLLIADGVLLIAAADRLYAFNETGIPQHGTGRRSSGRRESQ